MEQEMQTLPGELDAILQRIDQGKWQSLTRSLDQDLNQLLDRLSTSQGSPGLLTLPLILTLQPLDIRPVTSEDISRWRSAQKPNIRVVIGRSKVEVMAVSQLVDKWKISVSQITPVAQQRGYIVLNWDQYQKLLGEMGKLISKDEERSKTNGSPLDHDFPTRLTGQLGQRLQAVSFTILG